MNKYLNLFLILYFVSNSVSNAQSDSIILVSTNWKTSLIKKGVVLKQFEFKKNLFNSNQVISIVEITPNRNLGLSIGFETKILKTTSQFGEQNNAIAAINGNFFDTKNGGSVDYLRVNKKEINTSQLPKNQRAFHQKAAICFNKNKIKIQKWNQKPNWEKTLKFKNVMVTGPKLMYKNKLETLDTIAFNKNRHPRSAIIVTKTKKILFVTIDGRDQNAQGMSLFEIQKICKWLGAKYAINLDGGGSTTLWVKNQPENGIINYPCDNKIWDKLGERKVANVIMLLLNK